MNSISGVYAIRNKVDSKQYIGSSILIPRRWYAHKRNLNLGSHDSPYLQRAWDKYGTDSFEFIVLLICHESMTKWYEQQFIDAWKPEYNGVMYATGFEIGHKHSKETIEKLKIARKSQTFPPEMYRKLSVKFSGEGNPSAKLTEENVMYIWNQKGKQSKASLAREFEVSSTLIHRIYKGQTWKSVTSRMN